MNDTIIGVDLAKRVFQLHATDLTGNVKFRKKLTREQFQNVMSQMSACTVVFEACGSASYWAREMEGMGHRAKLIAPQYVKPFVKRQKNDAADAEAIAIAARQPEMRFVAAKTAEQHSKAVLFRGRQRLVHHRTELVNALRATLYECGHVFPVGIGALKRMDELVKDPSCDLPMLILTECKDMLGQIDETSKRIEGKNATIKTLAAEADSARRLQTMPGVGPMTALAIEAFAPDIEQFKCGRDFSAWLGLVPKQHSSGGKERLGKMSKAGQSDIRRLLIIGAMSRIVGRARHNILPESWIGRMLERKPLMLVAIALANKMARQLWAMLTKNEDYRDPSLIVDV